MTSHSLRRWGAVLIAGGLLTAAGYSFFPSTPSSPLLQPAAALVLAGVLLMVPGLVALQRAQSSRSAGLGWTATALLVVALVVLEVPHSVLALVALDWMQDLDRYHASVFGQAEFPAIVCLAVGEVLLGVALWRARTYPRWVPGLVLANLVVTVVSLTVPSLASWLHVPSPNYLLVGLLGLGMLRLAATRDATPVDANRATPAAA